MKIGHRSVGAGDCCYLIAEISANHGQKLDRCLELVQAAIAAGTDAIKLQTYTADTLTLDVDRPEFLLNTGTLWDGTTLHALYQTAYTPWEWYPTVKELTDAAGVDLFSTPFDDTAVDFLLQYDPPAWKIASFELIDHGLIRRCAATGKPLILSTGMATLAEIDEAVQAARDAGATEIALLRTNSAYPAPPAEMNLRTIPHLADAFGLPIGLSDHTLGTAVPVAAVALGACIIEKHICLSREIPGPDSAFSLEPHEFRDMVDAVRIAEACLGTVNYGVTEKQRASQKFRRSLFIVQDLKAGDVLTPENVRSIRPGDGLPPKFLDTVLGVRVTRDVKRGEPLSWALIHK